MPRGRTESGYLLSTEARPRLKAIPVHASLTGIAQGSRLLRPTEQRAIHIKWRKGPMANVVKKHSISSELAQKMVDKAVAKAREVGVSENVAILDDGGNLKAFSRMDGAPILCIRSEEHTSELQSRFDLVCRLLLEKKNTSTLRRRRP